ncbi:cell envelope integrity protein CreD [Chromobacterium haemolyticum]|nr:cell envelope integrity protein CreD [Chromobacterium haemolyticum]
MKKNPLLTKILILLALSLALLVPVSAISNLISERKHYQEEAVEKVVASTSGEQTVIGPVLVIPYVETVEEKQNGKTQSVKRELERYVLPRQLAIDGKLKVSPRSLGIYQALIFGSEAGFSGHFEIPSQPELLKPSIQLKTPYLAVGISDPRGIGKVPQLSAGGKAHPFAAGAGLPRMSEGIHAPLPQLLDLAKAQTLPFAFQLNLQGTRSISYVPVGESSTLSLASNWPHPSFIGNFLPVQRNVDAKGFKAQWESSWFANNLNDRFQQAAFSDGKSGLSALPSFSTGLVQPVDQYQQNERSVKYAVLFIGLTFLSFFLLETLRSLRVHPIQYVLVGMALVMFFLILLALSEHLGFGPAYLLAATACVGQIGFYVSHILGGWKRGLGFAGLLSLLYAVLYGLLQSEDNALLLGSLLLFAALTAIMTLTRRLDWYRFSARSEERAAGTAAVLTTS